MHIIDPHVHWAPRKVMDFLCQSQGYPHYEKTGTGEYRTLIREGGKTTNGLGLVSYDLEAQFEHMEKLGHRVDMVMSTGPKAAHFSCFEAGFGRDAAMMWNEEMAAAQKRYPGRLWSAAAVPLVDTDIAIEVLEHAVLQCGAIGVCIPGSIGPNDGQIDAKRLEPFYDRCEQLGATLFMHPTDIYFDEILDSDNGSLFLSLGRVMDLSVAVARLIFSGVMERHPNLKVYASHGIGALPYQAGRLDKNGKGAKLPHPPSHYVKQIYTDTVQPHAAGMRFAIDYLGIDHVMYASDYPCWRPAEALKYIAELGLSAQDQQKLFYDNARRILNLKDAVAVPQREAAE